MPKRSQNRRRGKTRNTAAGDRLFVSSHHGAGRAEVNFPAQDLTHRPPTMKLQVTMPKNILNQVVWLQCVNSTFISTSTTVVSPFAFQYRLSDTPFSAEVQTLFDQYSIYAVHVTFQLRESHSGSVTLVTVVDYDGQTFLSPPATFPALQQYSTALTATLDNSASIERFIKPCCAVGVYNTSTPGFTGYATDRLWVDSGVANVPFYGLLGAADTSPEADQITVTTSYVVCCRNNN